MMAHVSYDAADVYGFFDIWWEACMGETARDFTEGIYEGADQHTKSLEEAQHDQRAWVLDQARVGPGTRLLEIGCGLGSLLEDARARGAEAIGITPNPHQVQRCRAHRLDVRELSWQKLGSEYDGKFDVGIANGSLEHYVTREQAELGHQDEIYTHFFDKVAACLDPDSDERLVVLTFISFNGAPSPTTVARPTKELPWLSHEYHFRMIERMYRGWYPDGKEQVLRAAAKYFDVISEQDGTRDYWITSLEWARRGRRGFGRKFFRLLPGLMRWALLDPDFGDRLRCLAFGSWGWQFDGERAPCALNRVTLRLRN